MVYRKGTLLIPTGPVHHLHIVMNDPVFSPEYGDQRVLIVNISSIYPDRYHDPACVLDGGCHPFVVRPSYVYYRQALVSSVPLLGERIEMGEIRAHHAVNDDVYGLVRQGFDLSPHVAPKIKRFMRHHGI